MQELLGRLTSLDPDASASLKVIAYFDALVAGDVRVEALVRAAALLSGTVAGVESPQQCLRVAPDGGPAADAGSSAGWPGVNVSPDERVWIERSGHAHANDAMVLERFALAVGVLRTRRRSVTDDPVQLVIDVTRSEQERAAAATRLRLGNGQLRVVATPPAVHPTGPSTLIATAHGVVRATIVAGTDSMADHAPAGIGGPGDTMRLPASWSDALLALRLTDADHPRVDAAVLGVLLPAVRAIESEASRHPDVATLSTLDVRSAHTLAVLVEADSVRAAAGALGMHHSSLQARHEALGRELGYDPRSPLGRARYQLAALLLRLDRH
ncbi:hypothetical protein EV379_1930 [Microterricola gilva]|uniref:Uncharacterized protein n=1 Tax=Microterricola gilva TaxID=393267 RepID=A0A4V2GAU0_9MICO|nr:hypothetical protein [Microterricola gilva]RZU65596.1 hypothetical protein EV379_1930 [Microterricola gilva]